MKKNYFLKFALAICLCGSASSAFCANVGDTFTKDDITYKITSATEVQVGTGSYGEQNTTVSGELVIPATVTDNEVEYAVTAIGDYAFFNNSTITSVTIGDNVKTIGDWAFCCYSGGYVANNITSLTLGNSVKTIGDYAFYKSMLTGTLTIPNSVETIGDWAFGGADVNYEDGVGYSGGTPLTSLVLGSGLKTIGNAAFRYLINLTGTVTIPDGVTSIGTIAFMNCVNITSINIPASLTSIGESVFQACQSLTSITIPANVASIGTNAFFQCSSLATLTFEGSPAIGDQSFKDCNSLATINIESTTLPTITGKDGDVNYSFRNTAGDQNPILNATVNTNLPSTCLSSVLSSAGWGDFSQAQPSATSWDVSAEGNCSVFATYNNGVLTISGTGAMMDYSSSSLPPYDYDYDYYTKITELVIEDGVTNVGTYTCWNYPSLTKVVIGNSVTSINEKAFYACRNLESLTLGNTVSTIGARAFLQNKISVLIIPASVTSIGSYAFKNYNTSFRVVLFDGSTVPTIGRENFVYGTDDFIRNSNLPIFVPEASFDTYRTAIPHNENNEYNELRGYFYDGTIPYVVTDRDKNDVRLAFGVGFGSAQSFEIDGISGTVEIPSTVGYNSKAYNVTEIGYAAFRANKDITGVKLNEGLQKIANSAFWDASNITGQLVLPSTLETIETGAFFSNSKLTSIKVLAKIPPALDYTVDSNAHPFEAVSAATPVNVPCGTEANYKGSDCDWSSYFTNISDAGTLTIEETNKEFTTPCEYCNVIVPTGKALTVSEEGSLTTDSLTLQGDAQFINNGTAKVSTVVVEKSFNDDFEAKKWYPIGFPFKIDHINASLVTRNLNIYNSETRKGDLWLKEFTDQATTGTENGNSFDYADSFDANIGYAIQFPSAFSTGSKVSFTSTSNPVLKNITEDYLEDALGDILDGQGYYLVANPSTNNIELSTANKYYIGKLSETGLSFALKTDEEKVVIKPFESFGIAYSFPKGATLRSFLDTEQATAIVLPEIETGAAEYYNLQGIRVEQPVKGKVYIEKRGDVAKKVLIK